MFQQFQVSAANNITIDVVCDMMGDSSLGNNMARYAAINSLLLDRAEEKCMDIGYDDFINAMRETSWTSPESAWGKLHNMNKVQTTYSETGQLSFMN